MAIVVESIVEVGLKLIDKWFPTQAEKDKAKLDLFEMQQKGEFKWLDALSTSDQGQVAINVEEAKSESLFKSGWRPAIGWTCASALAFNWLFVPLTMWICALVGVDVLAPPKLATDEIIGLVVPLLGLGVYRTYEKVKGKQ